MAAHSLTLSVWPQRVRIAQVERAQLPQCSYALLHALLAESTERAQFLYVSSSGAEGVTLVLDEAALPRLSLLGASPALVPKRFAVIEVTGSLGAAAVGIIASVTRPLADAQLSLFYLSSYDTDFVLVADADLSAACAVLARHFTVLRDDDAATSTAHVRVPSGSASVDATAAPTVNAVPSLPVRRALAVDARALHLVGLAPASLLAASGAIMQLLLWPPTPAPAPASSSSSSASVAFVALCVTAERVSLVLDEPSLRRLQELGDELVPLLSYSTAFVRLHVLADAAPLGFDEPGLVASLARPLAQAQVPIFQISSWASEHTLLSAKDLPRALTALRADGHVIAQ